MKTNTSIWETAWYLDIYETVLRITEHIAQLKPNIFGQKNIVVERIAWFKKSQTPQPLAIVILYSREVYC